MANCAHGLGGAVPFFAALAFAQRAWTALRALALRCSGVWLATRFLPPIFPPFRPIFTKYSRTASGCVVLKNSRTSAGTFFATVYCTKPRSRKASCGI
jgi:hypothetical protein